VVEPEAPADNDNRPGPSAHSPVAHTKDEQPPAILGNCWSRWFGGVRTTFIVL
jgi:hypothetical protein